MSKDLFKKEDKERIVAAIRTAEDNTSGEIRVHVEASCPENVLDRAAHYFGKLQMHKTALRNGVLFYLATKDHKFAIIGDSGINAKVPPGFWDQVKDLMTHHFKDGDFTGGLEKGIIMAGNQLKNHFPFEDTDSNELSDEISFDQ